MFFESKSSRRILYALALVFVFLIVTRLFVFARFLILLSLLLVGVGMATYLLVSWLGRNRQNNARRRTVEGQIEGRLDQCNSALEKNATEMATIRKNIQELENQRQGSDAISHQNKKETERLLSGFKSEMKLRESKVTFYQTCIDKLKRILHNHRLAKQLLEKEDNLRKLQEDHYEDLARMEELKYDVEMDLTYLDTIENLSNELHLSNDYKDAQRLNKELIEMTRGLHEL